MKVLGIESSCDDTGLAIYDTKLGLLGHLTAHQTNVHQPFGGVVPELASRDHIRQLLPCLKELFKVTDTDSQALGGVAYTAGPGLAGALLVGAAFGRTLAWAWGVPAVAVHHMEAHLLAVMLEDNPPPFPFLALIVSGGHTLLLEARALGQYHLLGETLDDAAGEAFDKVAKLLGLGYPGGPALEALALSGDATRYSFPRPMCDRPSMHFSFSGLKTAVAREIEPHSLSRALIANVAASFQQAVIDVLVSKCARAIEATGSKRLVLAGGVAANKALRRQMSQMAEQRRVKLYYPRLAFCTDNGAMIAYVGAQRIMQGEHAPLVIEVKPRWELG